MLTKLDIAAMRAADDLCVHLNARHPDGLVRLIKRRDRSTPFSEDKEHVLPAAVKIEAMRGQAELARGEVEAFAMIGLYHCQAGSLSAILRTVRAGDELTFSFYPDGHTNGYVAMAGLHADLLYLYVRRDGKTIARWEVDHSVCPDNSARMIRGIPNSESYRNMAADARKHAA